MSSERFEDLEDEVILLLKYPKTLSAAEIERISAMLADMERELKTAPSVYAKSMLTRIQSYRSQLAQADAASDKNGGGTCAKQETSQSVQQSARDTVEQGLQLLQRTADSINRSQQLTADTERVGTSVVADLGSQRDTLERTRNRLAETDSELTRSQRVLRLLRVKVLANRLVLQGIIVVEVLILLLSVYIKYLR